MSAYNSATAQMGAVPRPAPYGAQPVVAAPAAPPGTFAPGTKVQVGNHKVVIQKYFSEGGFAHVYLVKMPKPVDGTDIAVLKRVAVPDKENLANMRTEVETMKKLKGHRQIVTYIDSHASQLKGGGYEVFLLMEFCNGGGLIDFMNTRLQNRLTEPEILKIFSDVAEGVACMHYLKPPLLHRDIKVENVLITTIGNKKKFKLCDFGSTAPPRPAATTPAECRLIEDDIQKHTTLQYRSPEMIDVYRKQPIDEKSDIWALGVLLYKLCYYTTPFEDQGQLAILNASYKYPAYPVFSDRLKNLIASMLRESPQSRPNIYQVLREACHMQGIEVPIKDIYAGRTQSEDRRNQELPSPTNNIASPPAIGAVYSPPIQQKPVIPDVVPMRRGRPAGPQSHVTKPSPSPLRVTNSDPFAALDAKPSKPADELDSRFPRLDQFSLMHDQGSKFDFDKSSPTTASKPRDLSQRVTEKLADDAFASRSSSLNKSSAPKPSSSSSSMSRAQQIISSTPALQSVVSVTPPVGSPKPLKPVMISTGTMTSPSPPPTDMPQRPYTPSPVYRFPSEFGHTRSSSLPRDRTLGPDAVSSQASKTLPRNPSWLKSTGDKHSSSSRPSLEGGRPSSEFIDTVTRTRSSETRARPSSTYLESNLDYLREKETSDAKGGFLRKTTSHPKPPPEVLSPAEPEEAEDSNIESNVDFLKSMEDQDAARRKDRRRSGEHKKEKRTSLPSLSGTKTLLAGRFGDAFKKFEHNSGAHGARTPSPLSDLERDRRGLTPITGSEATDGRSDDGVVQEESDAMSPEQRRELERQRLEMEERRVAAAAAEFRRRLADRSESEPGATLPPRSIGGVTRAATIQNKVRSLLEESSTPSYTKTAEGYGKYTDANESKPVPSSSNNPYPVKSSAARKPILSSTTGPASAPNPTIAPAPITYAKIRSGGMPPPSSSSGPLPPSSSSKSLPASATITTSTVIRTQPGSSHAPSTTQSRPSAPPKPTHLNNLPSSGSHAPAHGPSLSQPSSQPQHQGNPYSSSSSTSPPKQQQPSLTHNRLSSSQLHTTAPAPAPSNPRLEFRPDMTPAEKEDYVADFSRRYPSLSGIEMVETVVGGGGGGGGGGSGGMEGVGIGMGRREGRSREV